MRCGGGSDVLRKSCRESQINLYHIIPRNFRISPMTKKNTTMQYDACISGTFCYWIVTTKLTHGQWWSIRDMHRLQIRQWWDMGGLNVWHCPHMECESFNNRCRSLGMAANGTLPGSVRDVFAWHANAIKHNTLYVIPHVTGIPSVTVNAVTVADEYNIKTHTKADIIDPAWSDELNHVPFFSIELF